VQCLQTCWLLRWPPHDGSTGKPPGGPHPLPIRPRRQKNAEVHKVAEKKLIWLGKKLDLKISGGQFKKILRDLFNFIRL
jgi:hypothetical protein